jgi:hypothetical protein
MDSVKNLREVAATLAAIVDLLVDKGIVTADELEAQVEARRVDFDKNLAEKQAKLRAENPAIEFWEKLMGGMK